MPELPEAEANRRRVAEGACNRTIRDFALGEIRHMDLPSEAERAPFLGTRITETRRHGKYIFLGSKSGPWMVVHLGMSGSLRVWDDGADEEPDHAKFTWVFEGDRRLSFRCPRKFGWVKVTEDPGSFVEEAGLGPDAMEIGDNAFADRLGGSKQAIKSALLDQKKLAGIGNLWSDETLYRSGLMPDVPANALSAAQLAAVHREARAVLEGVLKTNARYDDLPGDWLIHHREDGADCPRCGGTITKKTVGGRTAYHCPDHQEGGG
ncbi:Fpg/Nei family DNA glycosylase [Wenxinia saemankumensis]|uniref:Formamidopyrimidine-DNA glycosylase n=1 Tax=Wenxinia saemankumensis TaxID=1447782 RepID=A0A1M6EA03_9RHOB|nr:DNA-formamidopyrimidine glycosylase family protein [Wenxinia saemankumensis]SHI82334.1 formamidopyrimidine-DNA glycosylase [Wenxinia saemankumensis]